MLCTLDAGEKEFSFQTLLVKQKTARDGLSVPIGVDLFSLSKVTVGERVFMPTQF